MDSMAVGLGVGCWSGRMFLCARRRRGLRMLPVRFGIGSCFPLLLRGWSVCLGGALGRGVCMRC